MTIHESNRLKRENSKQYAAFLCYRNLEPNARSVAAAWRIYKSGESDDEGPKKPVPSSFKKWSVENDWCGRVRHWDEQQEAKKQAAILGIHKGNYVDKLENFIQQLEKISNSTLENSGSALAIASNILKNLAAQLPANGIPDKAFLMALSEAVKSTRGAIEATSSAKACITDLLGIAITAEQLKSINEED
jgi:hypothetical protein